jgi:hypothetical protein
MSVRFFHFPGVGATSDLRGVLVSKAAIPLEYGIIGAADFVEECNDGCSVSRVRVMADELGHGTNHRTVEIQGCGSTTA